MRRLWFMLAITPVLAGAQRTVDFHKADLIRTSGAFVAGTSVRPNWLEDSVRFWYISTGAKDRNVIYLVDPRAGSRKIFFDHNRMAAVLSVASDTILDPNRLPTFKLANKDKDAQFSLRKRVWDCGIETYRCVVADTLTAQRKKVAEQGPDWATRSPDKQWDAFMWNHNIYVRPAALAEAELVAKQDSIRGAIEKQKQDSIAKTKGEKVAAPPARKPEPDTLPLPAGSIQLTTDGEYLHSYNPVMWQWSAKQDKKVRPTRVSLLWSPDSKRIAIKREDLRNTRIYPIYSSTKDQPEDKSYYFAAPGDSIIQTESIHILDIAARTNTRVKDVAQPTIVHGMTGTGSMKWGRASDKLFTLNATRGSHRVRANVIDAATGDLKTEIVRDSNATFIELSIGGSGANWAVVNNGEDFIWFSQRDGWGHLYRFDEQGRLKNQITSGPFAVRNMVKVDSTNRRVYFTAQGREAGVPYYMRLYRVNFDGSGLTLLSPEEGTHSTTFTPKGEYMIDTYSRLDQVPITVLRNTNDGRVVMELGRGDAELMKSIGWTPGEIFQVKARDGVTDLYGVMFKPSDFDPKKSYPIITHIYPGPQSGSVGSWGFGTGGESRAIAELGFIVIQMDHQGTPGRSKSFHDFYYANMGDNGIPDHIAGIRQLAARYPWIDINRVGIFGHSGGGLASTDAIFRWPDFFKVAVSGAGNHHPATYGFFWAEKYQGLYNKASYDEAANFTYAKNLKGKLLLMHGDMDTNVHPANTMKVVDALIKANKSFDMIIYPDAGHGLPEHSIRMRWNYFVTHLLGAKPPDDYQMMTQDWRFAF